MNNEILKGTDVVIEEMSKDAAVVGGGGVGRPDMAQAGGKKPENLSAALEKAVEVLTAQVG